MTKHAYTGPISTAKREAAWSVALRLQQFGYGEISDAVTATIKLATNIVRGWEAEGKVRLISGIRNGGAGRKIYEVVPEHEIKLVPVRGDAYEQMWTTMRKLNGFSPADLVSHCAVPVSDLDAAAYCRLLLATGYLRVTQKAKPPHKPAIYRLVNKTGVLAPRHRRVSCIIDPNSGTVLPIAEVFQ